MTTLDRTGWDAPTPTDAQSDRLREVTEFFCPFRIEGGWASVENDVMGPPEGIWVDRDTLDPLDNLGEWDIIGGYSFGNGWIMHPSQVLGGALEADILANDGTYCLVTVDAEPGDWDEVQDTCVGWALLKLDN